MRILICDDNADYLNELKAHVEEYMKNHYINAKFYDTVSPKEILEGDTAYDIAFLDIQMPEIDGITLAKELKRRNGKVILFFVTAFEEYQDDAMNLQIFRFFEKPFDVNRLYASLDKAMEYIDESYVDIFLYENGEYKRVLVDDIVYIRKDNRKVIILTDDGQEYISQKNIDAWIDRLPNTFFYQVHKSFIINLHYVTKYSYAEVYLKGSIRISVATRKRSEFHKYWFSYLGKR